MATLAEVLGGIVADVTRACQLADRLARDSVEAYTLDPLLAAFPIPRVTLKDANLKLRFAVGEVTEQDLGKQAEAEARDLWKQRLVTELFPQVLGADTDPNSVKAAQGRLLAAKTPHFDIAGALRGSTANLVKAASTFISREYAKLPVSLKKKLPASRLIVAALNRELPKAARQFIPTLKALEGAKVAAQTNLQVLIRKEELERTSEHAIHEITFTLTLDNIQAGGADSETDQKKG